MSFDEQPIEDEIVREYEMERQRLQSELAASRERVGALEQLLEQGHRYELGDGLAISKHADGWVPYWRHWWVGIPLARRRGEAFPDDVTYYQTATEAIQYAESVRGELLLPPAGETGT